jgi:chaperonin GroES
MAQLDKQTIDNIIMVGDRVLIKPKTPQQQTRSGLYLPATVSENAPIFLGYVIKVGPGYPIPALSEHDESWKPSTNEPKYIPLQPREGDLAVYFAKSGYEIEINQEKYIIVSQSSILLLCRDEGLFK